MSNKENDMAKVTTEQWKDIMKDPFYCLTVDPIYAQEHEPMVTEQEWIKLQIISITKDENGDIRPTEDLESTLSEYFESLIRILKGGGKNRGE